MFLDVQHHLWLEYDEFIRESFIELRLQPKTTQTQAVASFVLAMALPGREDRHDEVLDRAFDLLRRDVQPRQRRAGERAAPM